MSTLHGIWNGYWWVLPTALMLLCVVGGILRGRKGRAGCWCAPGYGRKPRS